MVRAMKTKETIIRIRPFNMANFSGGSGYMPLFALYGMIALVPAALLLWTGMALPFKDEKGLLNYQILKKRLNRILLPICLIAFVLCIVLYAPMVTSYGGNLLAYAPEILWCAGVPTMGIYFAISATARKLAGREQLYRNKWLGHALLFAGILAGAGYFVMLFLDALCGSLNYYFR